MIFNSSILNGFELYIATNLEIITKERKLIKKKLTFKVINNIIFLTREIKRKIKEVKYGGFY